MTNKNPFEIRLDVLKMAQEMLEAEQRSKELKFKEEIKTMRSFDHYDDTSILKFIATNAPTCYTENEIVSRTEALYAFIDNKNR